jgi:DNA-binding transcriptional LysR family regulator
MNTEYLRYVLAIDEHQSINKAAKALYISQPTLYRILQTIEDDAGFTIFRRTNRGVETTDAGKTFIRRVRHMLAEIDQIQKDYFEHDDLPEDTVKLIIGSHRSSPALDAFIRYYKLRCLDAQSVNLAIQEGMADSIIEGVNKGVLDLGVISYVSIKENEILSKCKQYNICCNLLDDSPLCMQVSIDHPLASKTHVETSDLKPYLHITFSDEDLSGINYCSNIHAFDWRSQNKRILTNSRGALRSLILNSDGYYLGNNAQCELLGLENSVSIPVLDYPYTVKTAYIYRNERKVTEEERIYMKLLREVFNKNIN